MNEQISNSWLLTSQKLQVQLDEKKKYYYYKKVMPKILFLGFFYILLDKFWSSVLG